jgi:hypothetical protein
MLEEAGEVIVAARRGLIEFDCNFDMLSIPENLCPT